MHRSQSPARTSGPGWRRRDETGDRTGLEEFITWTLHDTSRPRTGHRGPARVVTPHELPGRHRHWRLQIVRRRNGEGGTHIAGCAPRLGDNPLVATDGAGISHIMVTGTFDRLRFVRARGKAVERKCDPRGISGGRTFKHANWLDMKHIMLWHASAVVVHQCGPHTVLW